MSNLPGSSRPNLFAGAFRRAPLYLAVTSLETGEFVEVNDAFVEITGYSRAEAVGKSAQALGLWVDPAEYTEGRSELESQGFVSEKEGRFRMKDGEVRDFLISAEVTELNGETRVLNAAVDITRRKRAEDALAELNRDLEVRVFTRTEQVRALAAQLTLAEARERGRLAQVLHDDLQQQLYAVQFSLHDVRKTLQGEFKQDTPKYNALSSVAEASTRLKDAVAIARTTTTNLSPPVLHGEGLAQALRWLGSDMLERYDLTVTVNTPGNLSVPDEAVRVLLFNLVRELLFNVVKHAGVGAAAVDLSEGGGRLEITVRDLGNGFDPAVLELEEAHEGSGLGLSGVRKRLELFGGQLQVSSTRGKGTGVTITLPTVALTLG